MKIHDRTCPSCGNTLPATRTKSDRCIKCVNEELSAAIFEQDRLILENLYTNVIGPSEPNKNGKREWTFTHSCGKTQTWVIGNLKSRLKANPNRTPCTGCR